jgi:hypothetical protein
MRRLFFDANVLFTAAHNPMGKAAFVIELAGRGHWDILTSSFAVEEARRNLARKYPDCLASFERIIADVAVIATCRAPASARCRFRRRIDRSSPPRTNAARLTC